MLEIITPREEARLSVAGCVNLIDRKMDAALVLDVGGGSTELSWVDLAGAESARGSVPPIHAWMSIPLGVVTLAERFPEVRPGEREWFSRMVEAVKAPKMLIGGLGMGFTLRAALTVLGPKAQIVVAELVPAVIAWARGPMAARRASSAS